jgi:hypothetical protein
MRPTQKRDTKRKKVNGRLTLFNQTKVVTSRKRPKKNLRKCKSCERNSEVHSTSSDLTHLK